jgi:hypothetical protein
MSSAFPWEGIAVPGSDYAVRLAAPGMAIPVYWGRNGLGQPLCIVEVQGDHTAEFNRDPVILRGIDIDLRAGDVSGTQRLVLTLQQQQDADLFLSLCETLNSSLAPVLDSEAAITLALAQLRRWKAFLSGRRTGLLSPEEVRGLFSELTFLRGLYRGTVDGRDAIEAWTGANGVQQDFVLSDTAIEIKSISGKERNAVRISSEDQLETATSRLFLTVFRLTTAAASPNGASLNTIVGEIEGDLSDAAALEAFQQKLSAAGYAPVRDYDVPRFIVAERVTYAVTEGFPRLVRSGLPDGVARVAYDVLLEDIEPFRCPYEAMFGGTDGSVGR